MVKRKPKPKSPRPYKKVTYKFASKSARELEHEIKNLNKEYPLVRVTWADAVSGPRWASIEETKDNARDHDFMASTVGYLIESTKEYVVTAGTINMQGGCADTLKIPRTWCKVEYLK